MGTEIYDCNGVPLEISDKVKLFNGDGNILLVGNVECCFGALGITTNDTINWDAIYDMAKRESTTPCFLYNDNFISFWEIAWNLNYQSDNYFANVEKIIDKIS